MKIKKINQKTGEGIEAACVRVCSVQGLGKSKQIFKNSNIPETKKKTKNKKVRRETCLSAFFLPKLKSHTLERVFPDKLVLSLKYFSRFGIFFFWILYSFFLPLRPALTGFSFCFNSAIYVYISCYLHVWSIYLPFSQETEHRYLGSR